MKRVVRVDIFCGTLLFVSAELCGGVEVVVVVRLRMDMRRVLTSYICGGTLGNGMIPQSDGGELESLATPRVLWV